MDKRDDNQIKENKEFPEPLDGGWGWMIVFASFLIHFIADGIVYTFGLFYHELLIYFGSGKGTTAWIPSLLNGMTYGIGPLASVLTNRYGCRSITVIGSLLATLGLMLSSIAPNVIFLYFSIGILAGAGFGLMYLPAIVSVTCYFEKKRAFATGIAVCGSGIGNAVFAFLFEWLIHASTWKGAMLIASGLVLNCCVAGALLRPLSSKAYQSSSQKNLNSYQIKETNNKEKNSSPSRHSICAFHPLTPVTESKFDFQKGFKDETCFEKSKFLQHYHTILGILYRKDIFYSTSLINFPHHLSNPVAYKSSLNGLSGLSFPKTNKKISCFKSINFCSKEIKDTLSEMMDFNLLKNNVFLIFAVSNFLTSFGYYIPHIYVKARVVGLNITSEDEASQLLSILGGLNTIGRLIFGFISDMTVFNRTWIYILCLTISGLSTISMSFAHSYSMMALYCAIFGLTCGAYVSLTSVILVDLLGLAKLTNAFGLLLLFQGIACLIGPPIIGWLYDLTESYGPGFVTAGSSVALSGLMLFGLPFSKSFSKKTTKLSIINNDT